MRKLFSHVCVAKGPQLACPCDHSTSSKWEVSPHCSASELTGLSCSEKSKQRLRSGAVLEGGKRGEGELPGGKCLTCAAFICIAEPCKQSQWDSPCVSGRGRPSALYYALLGATHSTREDTHHAAVEEPDTFHSSRKGKSEFKILDPSPQSNSLMILFLG